MRKYQYLVLPQCYEAIYAFYYHVALKYRHTYSEEMMQQNRRMSECRAKLA